jgi:hypothetical protein
MPFFGVFAISFRCPGLKRESKVLEIVRREAIGAGSSSLPKLFSDLSSGRLQG